MKQITNKEYELYIEYKKARDSGRLLTPQGLETICASMDYNPEEIGKHFLQTLVRFRNNEK